MLGRVCHSSVVPIFYSTPRSVLGITRPIDAPLIPNPGFINLDHLTHRNLIDPKVAPSFYEDAVTPESAKDSGRYRQRVIARSAYLNLSPAHRSQPLELRIMTPFSGRAIKLL